MGRKRRENGRDRGWTGSESRAIEWRRKRERKRARNFSKVCH